MEVYPPHISKWQPRIDAIIIDSGLLKCGAHFSKVRRRLPKEMEGLKPHEINLMQFFIYRMKQLAGIPPLSKTDTHYHHVLTDHGFVRALERIYRIDVAKLKDWVLTDILKKNEYELVCKEDVIVSVLQKIAPLGKWHDHT